VDTDECYLPWIDQLSCHDLFNLFSTLLLIASPSYLLENQVVSYIQKGVLYTHPILQLWKIITECVEKQFKFRFGHSVVYNVVNIIPQNSKAIAEPQAE